MLNKKHDPLFRPWKELKRLQDGKLHHFITRHLYPFSTYYRRLFDEHKINPDSIRKVEDLRKIPFTSKKDFLAGENPKERNLEFFLRPDKELIKKHLPKTELIRLLLLGVARLEKEYKPIFLTATGGTTHKPVSFLYTDYDINNLKVYGRRIADIFGMVKNERALNVFPYAPHLAFWQTFFAGIASDFFILSTGGGKTLGTEGNIRSLLSLRPKFMIGVPSYVYHLLKTAREQNHRLEFLDSIALGASRVPKGFKRKIANLLTEMGASDVKVVGTYGFTEARAAWAECPTGIDISSGYHTYPDKEVFEVIDPDTGEIKRDGEDGELVYTSTDARGSAVLRYRTGDFARGGIVYSPCPHCGRTVPRISSDIVRRSNVKEMQLSKIKGSLVNLNALEHILDDDESINEWQIEIAKKDNDQYEVDVLILYVNLLKGVDKEKFRKALNEKVFATADVSFNKIIFVSKDEILERIKIEYEVKAKKIVDKRCEE